MAINSKTLKLKIEDCLIDESFTNGLRKTDNYKNLECYCSDNPPNNNFERNIRGYIFENDNLIFKSSPYAFVFRYNETKEEDENVLVNENNIYEESFIGNLDKYEITLLKEGTIIRVFYHNEEWFTTTHRKLNAFKSKWGRESFGQIFEENIKIKTNKTLTEFYKDLDQNYSYVFLTGTTETTRVVSPVSNNVYLLTVMDKQHNIVEYSPLKNWYQKKLNFNNIQEAITFVDNLKQPFNNGCGLFLFSQEKSFKIINKNYEELYNLRYNLPSIPFAYLHNVFYPEKQSQFKQLYPVFKQEFDFYDSEIKCISADILNKYFRRFAKKEEFIVSKQEHNILYNLHGIYLKNKTPVTVENVIEVFKSIPICNLNKIISERKKQTKLQQTKLQQTTNSL